MKFTLTFFAFVAIISVSVLAEDYNDKADGGWVPIPVDNPDMLSALKAVSRELYLEIINAEENKRVSLHFGKVLAASKQVVAGMNYNVTFTLGMQPNCFGPHCVDPSQQLLYCDVFIYQDLKNSYKVTKFNWF